MKILYLEDNLEFRQNTIGVCLATHEVITASDGQEGIHLFDQETFDLILLDYEMHQVHGPEVLEHIRQINAEIPVIAVSMDDALNAHLLEMGATLAVPKRRIREIIPIIDAYETSLS